MVSTCTLYNNIERKHRELVQMVLYKNFFLFVVLFIYEIIIKICDSEFWANYTTLKILNSKGSEECFDFIKMLLDSECEKNI